MACFDNLISIEELCTDVTPTSGFYLNQIGINKKEIESIATSEYPSVQDFIDKKSAFATKKVTSEIYSHLAPKFKANSILAGARVGFEDNQKTLVSQSGFVGVYIKVYNPDSFIDFTISDISLFTDYTGTLPVKIYDVKQGKLLQTVNVTCVAGNISTSYEKITVSASRKPLLLWMGYDSTGINSYKTSTHNGCASCSGYTFSHRFVQVTGSAASSPYTENTLDPLTHTAGIAFNYSVGCNHESWLCNHRNFLAMPILYKTGIEICNHALLAAPNQRTMSTTTVNIEMMEKKLAHFTEEYDKLMHTILNNMSVPQDRNCFYCDQRITSKTILP